MHVDFLSLVKGGFFLVKKPLECLLSVYTNSETAIVACITKSPRTLMTPLRFLVPVLLLTSAVVLSAQDRS
jgi:hypothetical protein